MLEYVKFKCHVLLKKEIGKKTPKMLMDAYLAKRKKGVDYIINGVDCVVESVNYASGRTCIITKVLRKMDLDLKNENIRQK